jgi:hypothetical protein
VQQILRDNNIQFRESSKESVCDACQKAKSHQLPYPKSFSVSTVPLQVVFSDVWGPALVFMVVLLMIIASLHGYIC